MIASVLVNTLGAAAIAAIVWFHWGRHTRVHAESTGSVQQARIAVKGGYSPDMIVLRAHQPARLVFTREEASSCSDTVVFATLGKSAKLPTGQEVPIDLPPLEPGEYPFACPMGMVRGKLVVENAHTPE